MKATTHLSFRPPARTLDTSEITFTAIRLVALSSRLALEERALVNHSTGRAENVAEHSLMLSLIAPAIAELYYPELNANLKARFATIHDATEAYVGDTNTHVMSVAALQEKADREAMGIAQLKKDFAPIPSFVKLIDQYEEQVIMEARFVRVVDKWMPILVHFADKGVTLRAYITPEELRNNFVVRAERLKQQFPDFVELVAVREELTELAATHLY